MVLGYMAANSANAKRLVGAVLDELAKQEPSDMVMAKHWEGSVVAGLKFMTKPEGRDPEAVKRVEYLFPGCFDS